MMLGTYPITDPAWVVLLKERMIRAFETRPATEWERMFGAIKVPGAEVKSTCEWMRSEHALASGLVVQRQQQVKKDENNEQEEDHVLEAGKLVWHQRSQVPMTDNTRLKSRTDMHTTMLLHFNEAPLHTIDVPQPASELVDRGTHTQWLGGE